MTELLKLVIVSTLLLQNHAAENNSNRWPQWFPAMMRACPEVARLYRQLDADQPTSEGRCNACKFILSKIAPLLVEGPGFADVLFDIAPIFLGRDCAAVVLAYKPQIVNVVLPFVKQAPDQVCAVLLSEKSCKIDPSTPLEPLWQVEIPPPPSQVPQYPQSKKLKTRILHLTDIHLDLHYQEGSVANCDSFICCRNRSKVTDGQTAKLAGKYGGGRLCDIPRTLFSELLAKIKEQHGDAIDAVYVTGDYPPHDFRSADDSLESIEAITKMLKETFGDKKVFMVVGNHESFPVDSFPPEIITGPLSNEWLYSNLANLWIDETGWLSNDTYEDLYRGGFYTALWRPGWRVISINDNFCNTGNFWLFLQSEDPFGELKWLIKWLSHAEANGERVHILGHIPTGDSLSCRGVWSANYYAIVSRFRHTIAGQFFGHEHSAYYSVFYDEAANYKPISVSYVTPSVTSYYTETANGVNPTYVIWTFDSDTTSIEDYEQFYVALDESNRQQRLIIRKCIHSAGKRFNVDFTPQSMHQLALRFQTDDTLFQQYYKISFSKYFPLEPCSKASQCKLQHLCRFHSARSFDTSFCQKFVNFTVFQF